MARQHLKGDWINKAGAKPGGTFSVIVKLCLTNQFIDRLIERGQPDSGHWAGLRYPATGVRDVHGPQSFPNPGKLFLARKHGDSERFENNAWGQAKPCAMQITPQFSLIGTTVADCQRPQAAPWQPPVREVSVDRWSLRSKGFEDSKY